MSSYSFNPPYTGSQTATFRIGPETVVNAGTALFYGVGAANPYNSYVVNWVPLQGVDVTVTGVKAALYINGAGATAAGAYFVVLKMARNLNAWNGSTCTIHYAYQLDNTTRTLSAVLEWTGLSLAVPTLPTDQDVFFGVCFPKTDAGATIVASYMDAQDGAGGGYFFADQTGVTPATEATATFSIRAQNNAHMKVNTTFTTSSRRLYSVSNVSGAGFFAQKSALLRHRHPNLPVRTDGGCYYILRGWKARTTDNNDTAPVMTLYKGDNDGTAASQGTMTWSFAAAGAKTLAFGGQTNNLATAGSEIEQSGDEYDLALYMNKSRGKANLFYQNLTHGQAGGTGGNEDIATISHAAKSQADRNSEYALDWEFCNMSAAAGDGWQITTLEIGWNPIILLGDSQVSTASSRLGAYLPDAFTHDRAVWRAWQGGTRFGPDGATYVGGYQRYKSDTPGVTDLCEMRDSILVFCGMGVNDLISRVPTETSDAVVAELSSLLSWVITDWYAIPDGITDSRNMFIVGLPPLGAGYAESEARNAAIIKWNHALLDSSMSRRIPFYSPHFLVSQDIATYIDVDNLHYTAAGAEAVSAAAAAQYESNYFSLTTDTRGVLPKRNRPSEKRTVARPTARRLRF